MDAPDTIELSMLNNDTISTICADICGAKCCNFERNSYSVTVSKQDYNRLVEHGLEEFVTFQGDRNKPELMPTIDGNCIFLHPETKMCTIHSIKPVSCRKYPFQSGREHLPEWCQLYHRSSNEVKLKLASNEYEVYNNNIPDKVLESYQQHMQNIDLTIMNKIETQLSFSGANEYWNIYLAESNKPRKEMIKTIRKKIDYLKKGTEGEWTVYSVRVFSSKLTFMYQLNGLTRNNFETDIPYIDKFPPNPENLVRLLDEILKSIQWKNHFVAGIEIPSEAYEYIRTLNFETV